jgi:hydrogenase nickel incorporation protein HypA/HybF
MHEMGIAFDLYRMCRERMAHEAPARLQHVRVAIGECSAVEPELLRFAWEAVIGGTRDEGAALEVEWRPTQQLCANCGDVRPSGHASWLLSCPNCNGPLRIEGGQELDLLEFSYSAARHPQEAHP